MSSIAWYFGGIELYDSILNFSTQWFWILIATIYTAVVVDVFLHGIIGHHLFPIDVKSWMYKIFVFFGTTSLTMGRIQKMGLIHWQHHVFPDRPYYDNLDVRRMWFTVNSFSPLMYIYSVPMKVHPKNNKHIKHMEKIFNDVLKDPWTTFCDQNTVLVTAIFWIVLYYSCPIILFKILFMGRVIISIHSLLSGLGHVKLPFSYKNFNKKKTDSTYNNLLFHYLALGMGPSMHLQNNHHNKDITNTHSYQWYEIDVGSWIMRVFIRPLMQKKQ